MRTFGSSGVPYGAADDGSFWMSTRRFDTIGDVLGSIQSPMNGYFATANTVDASQNTYGSYYATSDYSCQGNLHIWVSPSGTYGKTISREIIGPQGCFASSMAVDGTGVLYAYIAPNYDAATTTGTLYEFPPNTTGHVPPSHTISNVFLQNLVGDAAGDLFAIYSATSAPGPGTLVEFAPGATTYTTVLPSVSVAAFALDGQGNIYAEVPTSSTTFQIEEFLAGSTTAVRIIGGANTTLTIPAGIAVLP
jgi:hypothetical protein